MVLPLTMSGSARLAVNSSPALFFSELIESINTTVNSVPEGIVTILGATGAGRSTAGFAVFAATGVAAVGAGCPGVAVASTAEFDVHALSANTARIIITAIRGRLIPLPSLEFEGKGICTRG